MMYQFQYTAIVDDSQAPTAGLNCRLVDASELFEAAESAPLSPYERLQILSDFRKLWLRAGDEFQREFSDLPEATRVKALMGTQGVLREIEHLRFNALQDRPPSPSTCGKACL
jgi:flagellar biosynthesis regulator FlaF